MKDERGLYYLPKPGDRQTRVYVRYGDLGQVEFRLWHAEFPEIWERHPWISLDAARDAASLYREERNPNADPLILYDLTVARQLLREDGESQA